MLYTDLCRTGLVESKIRILIGKLEYNSGIELAHVNCKTFNPESVTYVFYLCMPVCFGLALSVFPLNLNREEGHKLRWFIGLKLKKGTLSEVLLPSNTSFS